MPIRLSALIWDIVIVARRLEELCAKAVEAGFAIERFEHSINLSSPKSDLRVQLQTDARYQEFIPRSQRKHVLGYDLMAATREDVLKGKPAAVYTDDRICEKVSGKKTSLTSRD